MEIHNGRRCAGTSLATGARRGSLILSIDSPPGTVAGMTVCWVSREARTADYGTVLTKELDDDSLSYSAAAMDADRASSPARAELFSDWGFGWLRRSGDFRCADFDVGGS